MASHPSVIVNSGGKRKHQSISIQEKVVILSKLENGVPVRKLCDLYGIGSSTVYDIKKHKDKILKFYADSDSNQMTIRKTMKDGKSSEHDRVMMEWFQQCQSDGVHLTGSMIMDQAKFFHKELELEHKCDYTEGWLQRFKKRHGIVLQRLCSKKKQEDQKDVSEYIDDFVKLVVDKHFSADPTNNTDETVLYWQSSSAKPSLKDNVTSNQESRDEDASLGGSNNNAFRINRYTSQLNEKNKNRIDFRSIKIGPHEDERVIIDKLILLLEDFIHRLEKCTFVTEEELSNFYSMHEKLNKEKLKHMKQLRVDEMFKEIAKKNACRNAKSSSSTDNLLASINANILSDVTLNTENSSPENSLTGEDLPHPVLHSAPSNF